MCVLSMLSTETGERLSPFLKSCMIKGSGPTDGERDNTKDVHLKQRERERREGCGTRHTQDTTYGCLSFADFAVVCNGVIIFVSMSLFLL